MSTYIDDIEATQWLADWTAANELTEYVHEEGGAWWISTELGFRGPYKTREEAEAKCSRPSSVPPADIFAGCTISK